MATTWEFLGLMGAAVGGLIGWSGADGPGPDPAVLRGLFADLGVRVGGSPAEMAAVVRAFQARVGLRPDGVAGPRTVHALAHTAREARDLRAIRRLAV